MKNFFNGGVLSNVYTNTRHFIIWPANQSSINFDKVFRKKCAIVARTVHHLVELSGMRECANMWSHETLEYVAKGPPFFHSHQWGKLKSGSVSRKKVCLCWKTNKWATNYHLNELSISTPRWCTATVPYHGYFMRNRSLSLEKEYLLVLVGKSYHVHTQFLRILGRVRTFIWSI